MFSDFVEVSNTLTENLMLPEGYSIVHKDSTGAVKRRIVTTSEGDLQFHIGATRRPYFEMFKIFPASRAEAVKYEGLAWRIHR